MILRRLTAKFKKQDWFAVAIEIVVVILGVFIGIEVANWNTALKQHDAASTYVTRIREDLAENIADLESRKAYYQQVKAHAMAALAAFDHPTESRDPQFLLDAYQASQIIARTVGRNTYDEILSVGAINSFSDVAVRKQLAYYYLNLRNYEGLLSYIPPYRESLRRHMPYAVQREIVTKCPERVNVSFSGSSIAALTDQCSIVLPPADVAAAVAAVDIPEIKLDLNRSLADIDTKLILYDRVIARAKALDAFLAQQDP
ncbi:MAG: hypothetical protein JSR34_02240 [Proteobacteria bacterium]|nr:hypothetical protein [Pseudomonadota bacterium]